GSAVRSVLREGGRRDRGPRSPARRPRRTPHAARTNAPAARPRRAPDPAALPLPWPSPRPRACPTAPTPRPACRRAAPPPPPPPPATHGAVAAARPTPRRKPPVPDLRRGSDGGQAFRLETGEF